MIKYEYDTGGNLIRVKDYSTGFVYASYTGYTAAGQIGRTDFGNGVNTIYQYYAQNKRLFSITTSMQTTYFMNISYNYDNVGNISGITDYLDSTKNRTYGYDALNRLTSANSQSYGGNILYGYDKIGNMTYNCRYGYYWYDDNAHRHARILKQNGTIIDSYSYDANGNMISGAGRTFTYDYDNRATSIAYNGSAVISVYDESGQRVKKVTPSSSTVYIGDIYECKNGVCVKYIFGGSQRIVSITGSTVRYYHADHLGSSSVITDQNGVSVQSIYYYPYGEIHTNSGSDVAKHKFTGQEWDAETGLYYYGARYYDPKLARFISADTIVPSAFDPQALNRYSYCLNNPVIYIDPSGHGFFSFLEDAVSWVMDDFLGIEQLNIGLFLGIGGEIGFDFRNGVNITHAGVGIGFGGYANVSTPNFDVGGGLGGWATLGYHSNMGFYYSEGGGIPGIFNYSGTYYFQKGIYSVNAGVGFGPASFGVGYSNSGWSASPGFMGAYYNTGTKRVGFNVDVQDLIKTYKDGVSSRTYGNGYGQENGNAALNGIIDFLGTVTAGSQPASNHDYGYGIPGVSKNAVDFGIFTDMVRGSVSNLAYQQNSFMKAGIGLAISPMYYGAVSLFGGPAYRAAQSP